MVQGAGPLADPVTGHGRDDKPPGPALLRELVLRLPAAVAYVAGPDLVFEFANDQYRRYAGGRDLTGLALRDVPELAGQRREMAERAARGGQVLTDRESEVWVQTPGHEPEQIFADTVCQPVRDTAGDVSGVLLYGSDVTAHVRERHRLEALSQRVPGRRQPAAPIDVADAARRTRERVEFLQRVRQRSGQLAQLQRDRRQLETELRQAERFQAVGQLTSSITHDFRNVLGVIVGYAELGQDFSDDDKDPELRRVLEEIRYAAERGVDLCGELLRFSRRRQPIFEDVDLNDLISRTKALLTVSMGGHVRVAFEPSAAVLPVVRADRGQLEQVLLNLAVNARDAMPAGGILTIRTGTVDFDAERARLHPGMGPGRYVELVVSDTGIGMTPHVRAKIFERFYTTKRPGRGTGLGLWAVGNLIADVGGTIEVDSAKGHGTTFRIYLPAPPDGGPQRTA